MKAKLVVIVVVALILFLRPIVFPIFAGAFAVIRFIGAAIGEIFFVISYVCFGIAGGVRDIIKDVFGGSSGDLGIAIGMVFGLWCAWLILKTIFRELGKFLSAAKDTLSQTDHQ